MVSFITPVLRSGITNFNVVPGVTSYMNSGNFISAEYSLFVPAPVSTYDNSTNTSDTDEPPELLEDINDDDEETY